MFFNNNLFFITICSIILHLGCCEDKCGECMSNEVYCVDETSYYFCMNGQPLESMLNTCDEGHVCTADDRICVPKRESGVAPVCSSSCNKCLTNARYTCVSKTQYGRCVNNKVAIIGDCEEDSICSLELLENTKSICVPQCVADFFRESATCNNEIATTTTTTTKAPPTPNFSILRQQCKSAGETNDKKYFYIQNTNDIDCETYIYCEKVGEDEYEALLMRCKNGYFDGVNNCVKEKPEICDVLATTPLY